MDDEELPQPEGPEPFQSEHGVADRGFVFADERGRTRVRPGGAFQVCKGKDLPDVEPRVGDGRLFPIHHADDPSATEQVVEHVDVALAQPEGASARQGAGEDFEAASHRRICRAAPGGGAAPHGLEGSAESGFGRLVGSEEFQACSPPIERVDPGHHCDVGAEIGLGSGRTHVRGVDPFEHSEGCTQRAGGCFDEQHFGHGDRRAAEGDENACLPQDVVRFEDTPIPLQTEHDVGPRTTSQADTVGEVGSAAFDPMEALHPGLAPAADGLEPILEPGHEVVRAGHFHGGIMTGCAHPATRCAAAAAILRAMNAYERLRPLLEPRVVAVVGVSRQGKQGAVFLQGLLDPGFRGTVYVVNPGASEIMGVPSFPSVSALPQRPDLAILVLPAEPAIGVVRECAERGVPGVAMFTAGFNELGTPEGTERARRLIEAAGGTTRIIGPNCMGVYNPRLGIAMFGGMPSRPGDVGLISQSGSLVQFIVNALADRGLGCSKAVSIGNQLDLTAADFLEALADDQETSVIAAYLEGVPDAQRFARVLRMTAARKPVVLWKAGRAAAGARAARSHTGQMAGAFQVWQGLARQAGAVLVRDIEELTDTVAAAAALQGSLPAGRRLAIVTGPGGPAVSASDACEESGLVLAELAPSTQDALRRVVAAAGTSVRNPIDVGMVLQGATAVYGESLRIALADPGVDAALVIGGDRSDPAAFAEMLIELRRTAGKPILYAQGGSFFGGEDQRARLAEGGVAVAPTAERAVRAYARLVTARNG